LLERNEVLVGVLLDWGRDLVVEFCLLIILANTAPER
jgi:hypothetical protein